MCQGSRLTEDTGATDALTLRALGRSRGHASPTLPWELEFTDTWGLLASHSRGSTHEMLFAVTKFVAIDATAVEEPVR